MKKSPLIVVACLALAACGDQNDREVRRSIVGENWNIVSDDRSGHQWVALEQEDIVQYGTGFETQSLSLICSATGGLSAKAFLYPIERMYENTSETVPVEIIASKGGKEIRRHGEWRNGFNSEEGTPGKYVFALEDDTQGLVRFMTRARAAGFTEVTFLFPGDPRGLSSSPKNGAIQIDIRIKDFDLAIATLRRECRKLK